MHLTTTSVQNYGNDEYCKPQADVVTRQCLLAFDYKPREHTLTICTDIIVLYTKQDQPLY